MLAADLETMSAFLHRVKAGSRPYSTLAVWNILPAFLEWDTGALNASQRQLAKAAGVTPGDVSRAIDRLVELGVLIREEKGKYRVHPSAMWKGGLERRGHAEETTPRLTLVEGGRAD